jgi:hypothetical protein
LSGAAKTPLGLDQVNVLFIVYCFAPRRVAVARKGAPLSPDYVLAPTIGCMSRGVVNASARILQKR